MRKTILVLVSVFLVTLNFNVAVDSDAKENYLINETVEKGGEDKKTAEDIDLKEGIDLETIQKVIEDIEDIEDNIENIHNKELVKEDSKKALVEEVIHIEKNEKKQEKPVVKEDTIKKVKEEKTITLNTEMWTSTNVNLRSDKSTNSKVLRVLAYGTRVQAIESYPDTGWHKIIHNNETGYIYSKYLSSKEIKVEEKPKAKPVEIPKEEAKHSPYKIYLLGRSITYKNGGMKNCQSIIDKDRNLASTYGGAPVFSGDDGLNTHFAGHSDGAFNGIWNLKNKDTITITDGEGKATHYKVVGKYIVDAYGYCVDTGKDLYNLIVGTGGGESITLQTCKTNTSNWIIRAIKK